MKKKKNIQSMYQKKCFKENHVVLLLIGQGENKKITYLSMISIDSCMIIHYITEENIFAVIVYMISSQKKY